MRGKFITVEGPDGSGKTTQVKKMVELLTQQGFDVVSTREPGGTQLGEKIRGILLHEKMHITSEMLLFWAARAQLVHDVINPALEAGKIVICDRFTDSSFAYQGAGRGRITDTEELERFTLRGFEPDYTLYFDITLEESLKRIGGRNDNNAFDAVSRDFKRAVYNGYKKRFHQHQYRMVRIDAMQSLDNVWYQIFEWILGPLLKDLTEADIIANPDRVKQG